jgi:hypothetical protein
MTLPTLSNWTNTRTALHQAAQVIGAVRAAVAEPEPNWVHLGLHPVVNGLSTGELPGMGEVVLDFRKLTLAYQSDHQPATLLPLSQHTQTTLADVLEQTLAQAGHAITLKRDNIAGAIPLAPDAAMAVDYAQVLFLMAETLGRFRESLPGAKSRLVVWPHGFDCAFLWFATEKESEEAPHMAFGFSPYSADLERPYVYTYAHPVPAGITKLALPSLTRWHTDHWTGTVTDYDALREESDPASVMDSVLADVYGKVSPLLHA